MKLPTVDGIQDMECLLGVKCRLLNENYNLQNLLPGLLKPLSTITNANEGLYDAIERVLSGLEHLLEHLERSKVKCAANAWISTHIDAA